MICRKCGSYLKDGVRFCTNCGQAVQASEEAGSAQQGPYEPGSAQQGYEPGSAQQGSYEPGSAAEVAGTVHKRKISRFIIVALICGVLFALLSFAATVFTVINWRTIAAWYYQGDFSSPDIAFVVPYFNLAISLITLIVSVLALCLVLKQLKSGETSTAWETILLVFFGLRPLMLYLGNVISSTLWDRTIASDLPGGIISYQLSMVAKSAVLGTLSFIDGFCAIGIVLIVAGCGASIVTKRYIKKGQLG